MNDTTKPFIRTTDKETAEILLRCGYQLVSHDGKEYIFINSPGKNTEKFDSTHVTYTNILHM